MISQGVPLVECYSFLNITAASLRRRYNNVMMDEERKQQIDMFLGVRPKQYFPTLHLAYRGDEGAAGVPLDWPESDDEVDPLGLLTWPLANEKGPRVSMSQVGQGEVLIA